MPDARLDRTRHAYHDAAAPDCTCALCRQVIDLQLHDLRTLVAERIRQAYADQIALTSLHR